MKKTFTLFLLCLIPFIFTSCVDYVQSISYKNGQYQLYYKVTLSKLLLAMAETDPEDIFDDFDEDSFGELPPDVKINSVDTDLEAGVEFSFKLDSKTADENQKEFLPVSKGDKVFIPFLLGNDPSSFAGTKPSNDSMTDGFVEAILSSAKCRVIVSKKIVPEISEAYFEGWGWYNYSIPYFDYGDSYCLEIPFIVMYESDDYMLDRIVIEK